MFRGNHLVMYYGGLEGFLMQFYQKYKQKTQKK